MINTNHVLSVAAELTQSTADAYSFSSYGAKNWQACIEMLFARGYNRVEVECIMRSVFTRFAYDGREKARAKGTASDLARLMDAHTNLQHYIDETVVAQMHDELLPEKLDSRQALRLVWSR